jgi:dihydrofolate synthase/folylpolyglutamate synthase
METAIRTPEQAASWLEGLINVEKLPDRSRVRLSLDPIRALLDEVGSPERGLRPIHLAGSKGKGSTALLCEALLRAAGLRVGAFVQPHLARWTERFRIDGAEVQGDRLAAAVERLRGPAERLRRGPAPLAPSWFDVTTAAALLLFNEAGLDAVVLEVGVGGRLDSTNVVTPRVTAVTSIELEHTEILGDTLEAIAGEKAGILKAGVPAVTAELPPAAREVVRARAREIGAPLAELGVDFHTEVSELGTLGLEVRLTDGPLEVAARLPLLGRPQAANAAVAFACVRRSGLLEDTELARHAPAAFASVRLPGRIEVVGRHPLTLVDSCHTEASARALAEVIEGAPRERTHLVLSISAGKNVEAMCRALARLADTVTLTRAEAGRSLSPSEVAPVLQRVAPGRDVRVVLDPRLALRSAREGAAAGDLVVAAGSVYLAGIARAVFGAGDANGRA